MKTAATVVVCCLTTCAFLHVNGWEMSEDVVESGKFNVKPGGMTLDEKMGLKDSPFICKFTYASQGGTQEEYTMSVASNDAGTKFSCTVDRGGVSYLMFQNFRVDIEGAKIVEAELYGSDQSLVGNEQFVLDEVKNAVSQNDSKFGQTLGKIKVWAEKKKEEL